MKKIMKNHVLVVNWHILEPCQFDCIYCYAQWDNPHRQKPIFKDSALSGKLIDEIAKLSKQQTVRLSLAGGEPLLDKKIAEKITHAYHSGLLVSLITNGYYLKELIGIEELCRLEWLGVSIDSFDSITNQQIGRMTRKGEVPDYRQIIDYLVEAKNINPNLKIKINTVVNQYNWDTNFSDDLRQISPDKWKVLRVLPSTERASQETIEDWQYNVFCASHQDLSFAVFEDNDDMRNSYLMIDPHGRFFTQKDDGFFGYHYSDSILEVGIEEAIGQIKFDEDKFLDRYQSPEILKKRWG